MALPSILGHLSWKQGASCSGYTDMKVGTGPLYLHLTTCCLDTGLTVATTCCVGISDVPGQELVIFSRDSPSLHWQIKFVSMVETELRTFWIWDCYHQCSGESRILVFKIAWVLPQSLLLFSNKVIQILSKIMTWWQGWRWCHKCCICPKNEKCPT
jgi:hypothetical protein